MRPPNTFGTYGNYLGVAPCCFNQYLESPLQVYPSATAQVWSPAVITFYTLRMSQGIVDHVHYLVGSATHPPTQEELADAPVWQGDMLVLTLPESQDNMVYLLAHDAFHRPADNNEQMGIWGAYWVDHTPPEGALLINEGMPQSATRKVDLHIVAHDDLSGVAEVLIDGDLDPTDPHWRRWTAYTEHTDVLLAEVEGKKTVTCRLRDGAGNESDAFYNTIIYPLVRYFFDKLPGSDNRLRSNLPTLTVQTDNRFAETGNTLKEGADSGKFTSI